MSIRFKKLALITSAAIGAGTYLYNKKHADSGEPVRFSKTNADGTSGFDIQFNKEIFYNTAAEAAASFAQFAAGTAEYIKSKIDSTNEQDN